MRLLGYDDPAHFTGQVKGEGHIVVVFSLYDGGGGGQSSRQSIYTLFLTGGISGG